MDSTRVKKRILSYDIIRILAISMVVMIHVTSPYLKNFEGGSFNFLWGVICNGLSRSAVPLFVMLSGALMLNEDRIIDASKMKKSIMSVLTLLVSWSLIYASIYKVGLPLLRGDSVSLSGFIRAFLLGHYHLWFLYMILGLYLITPILRLFVKRKNSKFITYFCVLSLVFQFSIPLTNFLLEEFVGIGGLFEDFLGKFRMGFVSPFITYYLLGWYISNVPIKKSHRKVIYGLGLLSLIVTIAGVIAYTPEIANAYEIFYRNESVNILLTSTAIFIGLYYVLKDKVIGSDTCAHVIQKASEMSFGVYAIHVLVLLLLDAFGLRSMPGFCIPLIWLVTILISYAITWMASKIPYINKLFKC